MESYKLMLVCVSFHNFKHNPEEVFQIESSNFTDRNSSVLGVNCDALKYSSKKKNVRRILIGHRGSPEKNLRNSHQAAQPMWMKFIHHSSRSGLVIKYFKKPVIQQRAWHWKSEALGSKCHFWQALNTLCTSVSLSSK